VRLAGGGLGAPDHGQRRHRVPRRHRQPADHPRRPHARHVANALEQALVEGDATQAVGVGRAWLRDGHRRYVGWIEAGVDGDQLAQGAHQQPGADQQHDCQRHLRDDERAAQPRGRYPCRRARRGGVQVLDRGTRTAQRRGQAKQHASGHGHERRHGEHREVEADVGDARHLGRRRSDEQVHTPAGQQGAGSPARQRQDHALDQRLADEPPARRAERGPNRQLPLARGRPGEHQVGDVGAGDEQHERHGAEDDENRPPGAADHLLHQRHHRRAPPGVKGRIVQLELMRDAGHFGLGALDRDAILEPAERHRVAARARAIRPVERHRLPVLLVAQRHRAE